MLLLSPFYRRETCRTEKLSNLTKVTQLMGFPGGSAGKESACNAGDLGSIPGLGRSPGEEISYPLQCYGLGNSVDSIVSGVARSQTQLYNFPSVTCTLKPGFKFSSLRLLLGCVEHL